MKRIDMAREFDKVLDTMVHAVNHHEARDRANAHLHLAGTVRQSPLTSSLSAALDALKDLRNELFDHGLED